MTIYIRNTNTVTFGPATSDWLDRPTHGVLWVIDQTDNGAIPLDSAGLSPALAITPQNEQEVTFAADTIEFRIDSTTLHEAGLLEMLQHIAGIDYQVSLHSGDPGPTFAANELNASRNPGYGRQTVTILIRDS